MKIISRILQFLLAILLGSLMKNISQMSPPTNSLCMYCIDICIVGMQRGNLIEF